MKPAVFVVIIEEIIDRQMYEDYIRQVIGIVRAHNGEYLARGNRIIPYSGPRPDRSVIIAFNSTKQARECFASEKYKKIKSLRENSTTSRAFLIENEE